MLCIFWYVHLSFIHIYIYIYVLYCVYNLSYIVHCVFSSYSLTIYALYFLLFPREWPVAASTSWERSFGSTPSARSRDARTCSHGVCRPNEDVLPWRWDPEAQIDHLWGFPSGSIKADARCHRRRHRYRHMPRQRHWHEIRERYRQEYITWT